MFHPDVMYQMAKQEHQARIVAAAQSRDARAARRERSHHVLAAIASRLRFRRPSAVRVLDVSERVSAAASGMAQSHGEALAA